MSDEGNMYGISERLARVEQSVDDLKVTITEKLKKQDETAARQFLALEGKLNEICGRERQSERRVDGIESRVERQEARCDGIQDGKKEVKDSKDRDWKGITVISGWIFATINLIIVLYILVKGG